MCLAGTSAIWSGEYSRAARILRKVTHLSLFSVLSSHPTQGLSQIHFLSRNSTVADHSLGYRESDKLLEYDEIVAFFTGLELHTSTTLKFAVIGSNARSQEMKDGQVCPACDLSPIFRHLPSTFCYLIMHYFLHSLSAVIAHALLFASLLFL